MPSSSVRSISYAMCIQIAGKRMFIVQYLMLILFSSFEIMCLTSIGDAGV